MPIGHARGSSFGFAGRAQEALKRSRCSTLLKRNERDFPEKKRKREREAVSSTGDCWVPSAKVQIARNW